MKKKTTNSDEMIVYLANTSTNKFSTVNTRLKARAYTHIDAPNLAAHLVPYISPGLIQPR